MAETFIMIERRERERDSQAGVDSYNTRVGTWKRVIEKAWLTNKYLATGREFNCSYRWKWVVLYLGLIIASIEKAHCHGPINFRRSVFPRFLANSILEYCIRDINKYNAYNHLRN